MKNLVCPAVSAVVAIVALLLVNAVVQYGKPTLQQYEELHQYCAQINKLQQRQQQQQ